MGIVLRFIEDNNEYVKAYDTFKYTIDEKFDDVFGDFEDHKENHQTHSSKAEFAEDHPNKTNKPTHKIDIDDIQKKHERSNMMYFLDGSRHVYKTSDMVIDDTVYPVVSGQIVVGCCKRVGREIHKYDKIRKIVLAVPRPFDRDNGGVNFLRLQRDAINQELLEKIGPSAIQFDQLICYRVDGEKFEPGRNKYLHQAITVIQNEMMDQEQIMVGQLCSNESLLSNTSWLVKDGTLEYKREFTNRPEEDIDIAQFKHKMKYVIGVSKGADPELLSDKVPNIGRIIAELEPYSRTNAYKFRHQNKTYCIWYLRLRNTPNKATMFSDVVKVEFIMTTDKVESDLIDNISAHLINEAFPVCYGKDSRWANHIYPIYLTECYCKSQYMNDERIIKVI